MPLSRLRGSTALVALALAFAAPLPLVAQEVPTTVAPASQTEVSRFGLRFAVPTAARIVEDRDTPAARAYGVRLQDRAADRDLRMGVRVLTATDIAELPATPGTEAFTAFLSQVGTVPVTPNGVTLQLGERVLHVYSGIRTAPDSTEAQARMMFLITHEADAAGEGLLVAVFSEGIDADEAARIEAEFVTSLAVEPVAEPEAPVAEVVAEPETPVAEATPAPEAAVVEVAPEPEVSVAEVTPEPEAPVVEVVPEPQAAIVEPPVAEATPEPEAPVVEVVPQPEAQVVEAVPTPAPVQTLALLNGAASLVVPEGVTLSFEQHDPGFSDVEFVTLEGRLVRIAAGPVPRGIEPTLLRVLHGVDSIEEVQMGGLQAWLVRGEPTRSPADARTERGSGHPAVVIVPALCDGENPSYIVALAGEPGGAEDVAAMMAGLTLNRPETAVDCPTVIDALRPTAAVEEPAQATSQVVPPTDTPVAPPQAAPATVPADWERLERFGVSFALPLGIRVRRDRDEAERMEYWAQWIDQSGEPISEFSLRVMTAESLARLAGDEGAAPGTPGFEAMLARFGGLEVQGTDEIVTLGTTRLMAYRGEGMLTRNGNEVSGRILYLIAEAPNAQGLSPWVAIFSGGRPAAEAAAFEASVQASLGGDARLPEGALPTPGVTEAPPQVTIAPPPVVETPTDGKDPQPVVEAPVEVPPVAQPERVTTTHPLPITPTPEAQAWADAQAAGSIEAVQAYLNAFPRGLHSGEARAWLQANVRAVQIPAPTPSPDDEAWALALSRGTAEAFWTYLKAQPDGAHADEASALLASRPMPEARTLPATPLAPPPIVQPGK